MRKFSKILTLILVLVAILTAFTVVALADGETTTPPITATYGQTFDSYEEGHLLSYDRTAQGIVRIQDNGNKYAEVKDNLENSVSNSQWDIYPSPYGTVVNYPYFMLEFDIMTMNGKYSGLQFNPRPYNGSANTFLGSINFDDVGLSTTKYVWNHFSIIVEYVGQGKFVIHRYVNGKFVKSTEADISASTVYTSGEKNMKISSMKLYPSTSAEVAMDNMYLTYFPVGYLDGNVDAIANYRYNYGEDYTFPYTYTKAWVGDTPYDDLGAATSAMTDGVTVKLAENTKEALVIDKAITLDTNIYDAEGNPTGSFYTYEYKTSKGLVPTETAAGSGIYTFARSENAVDIIWDEACGEDCDCYSEFGGHRLTTTTTVLLGTTPEFFGEIPTWEITDNYTQKKLMGWSYQNDGTVDTLLPISEADVAAGTAIKLYPVYKNVVHRFAVISNGVTEYYPEEDFGALLSSAPSGATIKLIRDVYTEVSTVKLTKALTIDLNGHTLKRCFVYGNVYEATKNGDEFVYDTTTLKDTIANGGDILFQYYANYASLTITSSTGSGTFYNLKMNADIWTYGDEDVKRVSKSVTPARITNASESVKQASYISLTLNGGITVYAGQLFYSLYASGTDYNITVDDVKYYKLDSSDFIYSRTNYTIYIYISNSLIYAPNNGGNFMYLGTDGAAAVPKYSEIKITNCDILKAGTGWGFYLFNSRPAGYTDVIFDNCRLYDAGAEDWNYCDEEVVGINGTLGYYTNSSKQESIPVNAAEDWSVKNAYVPVTYYVPGTTFAVTDDEITVPTFNNLADIKHNINYNRVITKEVDVNWVDGNGNTVKTEKLMPGIAALEGPRVVFALDSDDYRNILAQWVDEDGNALAEKLGVTASGIDWQDSYTFRAVETIDGTYEYTGGIKDVLFNISFTSNFRYNLYLPERDTNITFNSISTLTKGELVKIGGVEYRV